MSRIASCEGTNNNKKSTQKQNPNWWPNTRSHQIPWHFYDRLIIIMDFVAVGITFFPTWNSQLEATSFMRCVVLNWNFSSASQANLFLEFCVNDWRVADKNLWFDKVQCRITFSFRCSHERLYCTEPNWMLRFYFMESLVFTLIYANLPVIPFKNAIIRSMKNLFIASHRKWQHKQLFKCFRNHVCVKNVRENIDRNIIETKNWFNDKKIKTKTNYSWN